uniref:Uncharacterized protein n=1 Tax=Oryza nivara TaxID=4536 RepID=A0A0E0GKG5_ORYNI
MVQDARIKIASSRKSASVSRRQRLSFASDMGLLGLSTSDQDDSSRTWPTPPCSGRRATAAADDVRITRFTVPALRHDLITFRVEGGGRGSIATPNLLAIDPH